MLRRFAFTLNFWRPDGTVGDTWHIQDFVDQRLSELALSGLEQPRSDKWVTVLNASFDDHREAEDPHEELFEVIINELLRFANLLDTIPESELTVIRNAGYSVTAVADTEIDDNQIELELPSRLLASLGRLDINLRVNSDEM